MLLRDVPQVAVGAVGHEEAAGLLRVKVLGVQQAHRVADGLVHAGRAHNPEIDEHNFFLPN